MAAKKKVAKKAKAKAKTTKKAAKKPAKRKSGTKDKKGLSSQHLAFCRHKANGKSNVDSYMTAYKGTTSQAAARSSSTDLLAKPNIIEKIEELREAVEVKTTLSRLQKRQFLRRSVEVAVTDIDEDGDDADLIQERTITTRRDKDGGETETVKIKGMSKLEAIKIDNMMQGDNEPEEINLNATGEIKMSPIAFVRQNLKTLRKRKESVDNDS